MLIDIKLETSAQHAAFNEAIQNAGLQIYSVFDADQKYMIKTALDLYRQKLELNMKACVDSNKSELLAIYFDKKIQTTRQLINKIQ